MTGMGVYSYGNSVLPGSSVTDYLQTQSNLRDTTVVILPTSSKQELQMVNHFAQFKSPNAGMGYLTNCAPRTANALMSSGVGNDSFVTNPEAFGFPSSQLNVIQSLSGAITISIPQYGQVPSQLNQFNPMLQP